MLFYVTFIFMSHYSDVLIVGGGLAGLAASLHLKKAGVKVTLIEKENYPHHKVCGEYVSNEVMPYLNWLGVDISSLETTIITHLEVSTVNGNSIFAQLPLGGFGISRYQLDNFLYQQLITQGIDVLIDTVDEVTYNEESFEISTSSGKKLVARQVIGAYGKRSLLDIKFNRPFIQKKSHYLAVKAHYAGSFPKNLVGLHHFKGGYCGVSKIENEQINICYLTEISSFKAFKNLETFEKEVLYKNTKLKQIFEQCEMLFDKPLTISQVSFERKSKVENHILMIGDSAGLIHPLCGNGMAMAIHAAKIAAELVIDFLNGKISRVELENKYQKSWQQHFSARLNMGKVLSKLFMNKKTTNFLICGLTKMPWLLKQIIKRTHGKKISIPN